MAFYYPTSDNLAVGTVNFTQPAAVVSDFDPTVKPAVVSRSEGFVEFGELTPNRTFPVRVSASAGLLAWSNSLVPTVQIAGVLDGPITLTGGTTRATVLLPDSGMRLDRFATQIYNLWGIEVKTARDTDFARPRVLEIINGALQLIYAQARVLDYFNRQTATLSFDDVASMALPEDFQTLLGPVRFADTKQPLKAATTLAELEQFVDIHCGGVAPDGPRLYYIDARAAAGTNSSASRLHLAPAPTGDAISIEVDYAVQAPRYETDDLLSNVRVPLPQGYAETILLPICKHMAASDGLFRKEPLRQSIAADYSRAMQVLGLVEPEKTSTRDNRATPRGAALAR